MKTKTKTTFQFYFIPFFISFIIGILYIYITTLHKKQIIKIPTPFSNYTYKDFDNECYKIKINEIKCKGDEPLFNFT